MIKYNNKTIYDWNFDTSNLIKVYRNNAICYYKVSGGGDTPTSQTPCYAVVTDISQYSDTEFEDVFNKADESWYKLNNLNQYEKYGVYGSGRTITTYEGKLTIDDGYEYQYSGNSWVNVGEVSGSTASLPNVPFVLNYNARNYDASTHTIKMTDGQLNGTDAVAMSGLTNIYDHSSDGYIYMRATSCFRVRKENQDIALLNRQSNSTNSEMTIVSKARTDNSSYHSLITNRDSNYNWMYRQYNTRLTLHGQSETGQIACSTTEPNILSVRTYYDNGTRVYYNNWTSGTSTNPQSFTYGSTNTDTSKAGCIGVGYGWNNSSESWQGDLYWIYMAQKKLTDEEIQQVIDYNEASSISVYPLYYDEIQDPPTEVSFDTMDEALAYDCPYVGLVAMIDGQVYMFNEDYEWEQLAFTITGTTTSSNPFNLKLNLEDAAVTVYQDNGDGTYNWGVYYPTPITNTSGMCSGNTSLRSFDWGDADTSGVTTLGNYSFYNCSGLTTMPSIPSNVTKIGDYAFNGCSGISASTIAIPEGITTIGSYSFNYFFRNGQKSLNIPSTLTTIGNYAFSNSNQTVNVYIDSLEHWLNLSLSNSGSNPIRSQGWLYINGNGIQDVTIPNNFSQVKQYAFYGYKHLNSLTIPSNVTSIGQYAFYGVSPITSVTIPSSVTSIGGYTFYDSSLKNAVYNSSAYSISTFNRCSSLSSVTLSNITRIGSSMFQYCYALSSITIPSSVTYIDDYAFGSCTALTSVDIPSSVTKIGRYVFGTCSKLSAITIPSSVTSIGDYTFNSCTSLTSVTIEATTPPTLYSSSFNGCNALKTIYVPCQSVSAYRSASNWSSYADKIVGYEECTTYEWQTISSAYTCYEGDKYEKQQKMRSFDSGTTWEAVVPYEYQRGQLIESGSTDCGCRLPNGYTELEYVENSGNSSVNLGLKLNETVGNTYEIVFDNEMVYTNGWGSYQTFLACMKETSPYEGWGYRYGTSTSFEFYSSNNNIISCDRTNLSGSVYHSIITCSGVTSDYDSDYPLNLFSGLDSSKNPLRWCKGKLYNMTVTLNGDVVRNLVPCKRDSDSLVGLYDLSNSVFYYPPNYETYPLVGGAEVPCGEECEDKFVSLKDIINSSTVTLNNHSYYLDPDVVNITKIRVDTTKRATSGSYCWITFCKTPDGSEAFGINTWIIGTTVSYGSRNYITDANGNQTFAKWVDDAHTIVEIDIYKLTSSYNNGSDTRNSLCFLMYQENANYEALSFLIEAHTKIEYIEWSGSTSSGGGVQLLTNVSSDYYCEVDSQCVNRGSGSPVIIGQKSSVEIVGFQFGLCYYGNMFLDYGGSRLSSSINSTVQSSRHVYGVGHISGSSYSTLVGIKVDGETSASINATTTVENLPYLVGSLNYSAHTADAVKFVDSSSDCTRLWSVKVYEDCGDTLVGDYIPVIKNSDNTITLYDKISRNYATPFGKLKAGDKLPPCEESVD